MTRRTLGSHSLRAAGVLLVLLLPLSLAGQAAAASGSRHYQVTLQDLTHGQPISPPVAATHQQGVHMFEVGQPASDALAAIARDGNPDVMFNLLSVTPGVTDAVNVNTPLSVMGTTKELPALFLTLHDSVSFAITANPGDKFSLAAMFICTNDGFGGLDSVDLPSEGTITYEPKSYDAGREQNTERSLDIVDHCSQFGVKDLAGDLNSNEDNAVATLPAAPIAAHPGIKGVGDLTPATHAWSDPGMRVTITRVDSGAAPGMPATGNPALPFLIGFALLGLLLIGAGRRMAKPQL